MEKNSQIQLQEIIFGSSDSAISKKISKLVRDGDIRKIAPKIYSSNLTDPEGEIIRRNVFSILGRLYPGAVLSHRSAFEFDLTSSGNLFLTYKYTKKIRLPGVQINFLEGKGPIDGDRPFMGNLFVSQQARAFLENLQVSRKDGADSKTLSKQLLEEKLEKIVIINGEEELNDLRDKARNIAKELEMEKEFSKLNNIISALLSTRPSKILESPVAQARAFGLPYDASRIELFEKLFQELNQSEFKKYPNRNKEKEAFRNFALFESYFSNYIEGTQFELGEAKQIIDTQIAIPSRNEDSHDILGTFNIVSNKNEMSIVPQTPDDLLEILKYRHEIALRARQSKKPGEFKDQNNFAGNTFFVDKNLVKGTLIKAFGYYQALHQSFSKAAFMMFLISEVHPFLDGNGRIARIMMNAELVSASQAQIIIPTVYREDYLGAIRKLTRQSDPKPFIRMLSRAHKFSSTIYGQTFEEMKQRLVISNAFLEHTEAKLIIT